MIKLCNETLIPIREAPRHLPKRPNGKRIHTSACYRWISRGVRGVRLDSIKIGGSTYTSMEALQRFGDRLATGRSIGPEDEPATPRMRQRQIERAANAVGRQLGLQSGDDENHAPEPDSEQV